jgi:hypothetical protein
MPAREPLDVEDDVNDEDCSDWVSGSSIKRRKRAVDVDEDAEDLEQYREAVRKAAEQRSMKRRKRKNVKLFVTDKKPVTQHSIFSYLAEYAAQATAEAAKAKELRALRLAMEAAATAETAAATVATAAKAAAAAARATLAVRAAWGHVKS